MASAASHSPYIVGEEHYRVACRVQEILEHYKELQDIIAILGNAFEQIDRAYHCAFFAVFFLKIRDRGFCAFSPKPNGVCRVFSSLCAANVDGMVFQNFVRIDNEGRQVFAESTFWKILAYAKTAYIRGSPSSLDTTVPVTFVCATIVPKVRNMSARSIVSLFFINTLVII